MLVEDNAAVRQAAKRILSECGYVVLEAGSGLEAIDLSRQHTGSIDLLLADVHMPGMNGREVARQLRTERPDLRVLYMSGYEPDRPAGDESDPMVFFQKPFTGAALLEKLRQTLDSRTRRVPKESGKRKREKP